jgi:hypothetical protein
MKTSDDPIPDNISDATRQFYEAAIDALQSRQKTDHGSKTHVTLDEAKPVTDESLKHRPSGFYNTFSYVGDQLHETRGIDHTKAT